MNHSLSHMNVSPDLLQTALTHLNPTRSQNIVQWREVGHLIHSILPSSKGLKIFCDWSSKYDRKSCDMLFNSISCDVMTINTLRAWIIQDQIGDWVSVLIDLVKDTITPLIPDILKCKPVAIATLFKRLFDDCFVCIYPHRKNPSWYNYNGLIWQEYHGSPFNPIANSYISHSKFLASSGETKKLEQSLGTSQFLTKIVKEFGKLCAVDSFRKDVFTDLIYIDKQFIQKPAVIVMYLQSIKQHNLLDSPQYVYLLQEREFFNLSEPVYKIGKTKQSNLKRFKTYPKGSVLILQVACHDCSATEKSIMNLFRKMFVHCTEYGREYFRGDVDTMKVMIFNIATEFDAKTLTVFKPGASSSNPSIRDLYDNSDIDEIIITDRTTHQGLLLGQFGNIWYPFGDGCEEDLKGYITARYYGEHNIDSLMEQVTKTCYLPKTKVHHLQKKYHQFFNMTKQHVFLVDMVKRSVQLIARGDMCIASIYQWNNAPHLSSIGFNCEPLPSLFRTELAKGIIDAYITKSDDIDSIKKMAKAIFCSPENVSLTDSCDSSTYSVAYWFRRACSIVHGSDSVLYITSHCESQAKAVGSSSYMSKKMLDNIRLVVLYNVDSNKFIKKLQKQRDVMPIIIINDKQSAINYDLSSITSYVNEHHDEIYRYRKPFYRQDTLCVETVFENTNTMLFDLIWYLTA